MFAMAMERQEPGINWVDLFARARGAVQMKHETLAGLMGVSPQQLSMQLAGNGHVSLFRLASAAIDPDGKLVVMEVLTLIGEELGFGEADPVARAVGHALSALGTVVGQLSMAKAKSVPADRRDRRRA